MKGSGLPRWRATLHFHSVAATKAGLLVKSDGRWRVTDEGQKFVTLPDYELKRLMRSRYREWRWSHQKVKTALELQPPSTKRRHSTLRFCSKMPRRRPARKSTPISTPSRATNFRTSWRRCLKGWDTPPARFQNQARMEETDILAYIDPLGAKTPHIRVQVKHRDQTASREDVAALRGIIRGDREIGLFVVFFRRLLTGGASRSRPWRRSHRAGRPRPFS